jgi:hypothetical protein
MRLRSYLTLGFIAAVLAVIFFLRRSPNPYEATYTVPDWKLPIDTTKIVRIDIRHRNGSAVLEQKDGFWSFQRVSGTGIDTLGLERLLRALSDFRLLGQVSSNPRKRDIFGVGVTGTAVDVITEDGNQISLVVGKMSALPPRAYIRPVKSNNVYLSMGLSPEIFRGESRPDPVMKELTLESSGVWHIAVNEQGREFVANRSGTQWRSGKRMIPDTLIAEVLQSLEKLPLRETIRENVNLRVPRLLRADVRGQNRLVFDVYDSEDYIDSYLLKTTHSEKAYLVAKASVQPLDRLFGFLSSAPAPVVAAQAPPPVQQRPAATPPQRQMAQQQQRRMPPVTASMPPQQQQQPPQQRQQQRQKPMAAQTTTRTPAATNTDASLEENAVLTVHTVKAGESLGDIAGRYGVSTDQLRRWNLLTTDDVSPGVELYVFVRK